MADLGLDSSSNRFGRTRSGLHSMMVVISVLLFGKSERPLNNIANQGAVLVQS